MTLEEVLSRLESWGSERTRQLNARCGAGDNRYGVGLGPLPGERIAAVVNRKK